MALSSSPPAPDTSSSNPHQSPKSSHPSPSSTAPVITAPPSLSNASHPFVARPAAHASAALAGVTIPHNPPQLALASAQGSHTSEIPTIALDQPSAPIPIPAPKPNLHAAFSYMPSTPLTARERAGAYFPFTKTPARPQLGRSLTPRYAQHPHPGRPVNYFSDDSNSPSSSVGSSASMHRDRPSSPLSLGVSEPLSPLSPIRQAGNQNTSQPKTRAPPKLRLKSLPRFHPANYESSSSSADTTPRNSRPGTAQSHLRQFSDAQAKLHQYQRDLVVNATRAASLALSPKTTAEPTSPRLNPIGSPGPITPLALESGDDYLSSSGSLGSPLTQVDRGRELVQRLVEKENERRRYSRRSESHSPAVSPAGGRG